MRAFVLLVALLALAAPLGAQTAPARDGGFWIALGAGAAQVDIDCGRCETLPDSIPYRTGGGKQLYIAMGRSPSSRVLVGAQALVAFRSRGSRDATLLHLGGLGQFYPLADRPFFLRVGWGIDGASVAGGGILLESVGMSANAEVGLDLWRWGAHSFGPYLGAILATNGQAHHNEQLGAGWVDNPQNPRALYLGLSVARY